MHGHRTWAEQGIDRGGGKGTGSVMGKGKHCQAKGADKGCAWWAMTTLFASRPDGGYVTDDHVSLGRIRVLRSVLNSTVFGSTRLPSEAVTNPILRAPPYPMLHVNMKGEWVACTPKGHGWNPGTRVLAGQAHRRWAFATF